MSTCKLTAFLSKAGHGRFSQEKAKEIRAAAAGPFGVGFAKNVFAFQIKQLVEAHVYGSSDLGIGRADCPSVEASQSGHHHHHGHW